MKCTPAATTVTPLDARLAAAVKYIVFAARCILTAMVHVIFQPAEEAIGGADLMIKDGCFERSAIARLRCTIC